MEGAKSYLEDLYVILCLRNCTGGVQSRLTNSNLRGPALIRISELFDLVKVVNLKNSSKNSENRLIYIKKFTGDAGSIPSQGKKFFSLSEAFLHFYGFF